MDWNGYGPLEGQLWRYSEVSTDKIWQVPINNDNEGIISLATDGNTLFIGVGGEEGYYSAGGEGKIYAYDEQRGARLISPILSEGTQVLYLRPR
jgi:hypothetical protein